MNIRTPLAVCLLAVLASFAHADDSTGLDAWSKVHRVFSHPRCANCHVSAAGIPVWSGASYGPKTRVHGMNVSGGASRNGSDNGLPCMSCHSLNNASTAHGPPGAPGWALPPATMQWFGKSSAEICAQIKDQTRNGGRSLAQVADHVEHDALVLWGWNPGPGREPAPFSGRETAASVREWARLGAPCPKPK